MIASNTTPTLRIATPAWPYPLGVKISHSTENGYLYITNIPPILQTHLEEFIHQYLPLANSKENREKRLPYFKELEGASILLNGKTYDQRRIQGNGYLAICTSHRFETTERTLWDVLDTYVVQPYFIGRPWVSPTPTPPVVSSTPIIELAKAMQLLLDDPIGQAMIIAEADKLKKNS